MTFLSTYQRIISILTIVLLCWNFAGTLVSGLVVNHLHTQGEGSHCEIALCSCSVKDGQKICTCHHAELQYMNHTHDKDIADNHQQSSHHDQADFCYFSSNHNQTQSIPTVLVEFNKLNAVYVSDHPFTSSHNIDPFQIYPGGRLLTGITADLLKPPRV